MSYDFQRESRSRTPQTGTGENLFDEFERDNVEYSPEDAVRVVPFIVPGTSEPFSVLATGSDENGRIIERLIAFENFTQKLKYEYDAGGRLHKVWSGEKLVEEYLYGKYGERYFGATVRMPQRTFRYGPGLRLEKAGSVQYFYDEYGRLITKQDGQHVTRYSYHHSGQLEQVNLSDGRRINYTIDPEGRRVSKSINGKIVESYLWLDFTTLAVVTDNYGNRKEFAYDEDGDPIAMRVNEEIYYFATDQVGTIYIVANGEGNEVKRIIRDSFGNKTIDTNERMDIPLGFAAGLYDKDTGLVHFGYREYDPSIGRFITPDPLGLAGGDVDVYGYCADDPVNFIDRVGLFSVSGSGHAGASGQSDTLGGGSAMSKSSAQHAREMESKAAALGHNTNLGSPDYSGDDTPSGGGGQNATNNANYEKGSQNSLGHLNQSGELAGQKATQAAQGLAAKQAQFDASLQAKQDRKASAAADKRNDQRRAAIEATSGWSSPLADTVDPNQQAKPKADVPALDTKQAKKNEDDFDLWDLGKGMAGGAVSGALAFEKLGKPLGVRGRIAATITGGFYGAAVGAYDVVGIKGLADMFGVNKNDLEDSFGILGTAKPNTHKKDFK
ncbi:RHS repeat-associated core domain-containing protein [Desulfovibrio sp. JC022]|uniref:RHS repeat-associated core domain-containing protein n=1 Tax=Desulfovibrio sp. JC022 TaxID=2593642 RepID=UPI0013D36748|nr:RHS repeat-associated core domain-containing protein [Desulfovibrio sp. JC022]